MKIARGRYEGHPLRGNRVEQLLASIFGRYSSGRGLRQCFGRPGMLLSRLHGPDTSTNLFRPALSEGLIIVTDRFADSSLAYQWGARGLERRVVEMATELATAGLKPDLKILLDLPVETALLRRMAHTTEINRLDRESISFHGRVRGAYHSLVASAPGAGVSSTRIVLLMTFWPM